MNYKLGVWFQTLEKGLNINTSHLQSTTESYNCEEGRRV